MKIMGMGLLMTLFVLFLILKLAKIIVWSWVWVFAPLWIGALLFLITAVFFAKLIKRAVD